VIPYSLSYNLWIMNETMVHEFNQKVNPTDTTYFLGDMGFGDYKLVISLISRLNGKKVLVNGNHDHGLITKPTFCELFTKIVDYLEEKIDGQKFVMMHYPIYDWNGQHHGTCHLHGHRHGTVHGIPSRIMDVGFDATGKIVLPFVDIIERLRSIQPGKHH